MSSADATQRRHQCRGIALEAGELLRSRFGNPGEVRAKAAPLGDEERWQDVVTEVDDLSEQLIVDRIGGIDPHARILAEEGGLISARGAALDEDPAQSGELWIVDPLDGTVNFAHGIPHFCVSIACWRDGVPLAGAIVDPMVGESFSFERHAADDQRAFHDDLQVRLAAGVRAGESVLYVGGGGPRLVPLLRSFRSWRRLGSAALALAWTGVGRCAAYVQPGMLHPWDWAAGVPFIEAAGGRVTDFSCASWSAPLQGRTGVVAASPPIHELVARQLAELT